MFQFNLCRFNEKESGDDRRRNFVGERFGNPIPFPPPGLRPALAQIGRTHLIRVKASFHFAPMNRLGTGPSLRRVEHNQWPASGSNISAFPSVALQFEDRSNCHIERQG